MITVRVVSKASGKAQKGVPVAISFDGWFRGVTGKEITDGNGDAHFDCDPGSGMVHIRGRRVYEGRIGGRIIVYL
jgi:hypothetical protein